MLDARAEGWRNPLSGNRWRDHIQRKVKPMTYDIKTVPFDPKAIKDQGSLGEPLREQLSGAVAARYHCGCRTRRQAPVFMINGLKRGRLIAANSMICTKSTSTGEKTAAWPTRSPRLRQRRALAGGILRHGQGGGRRLKG
jgi:hypothetical protein